MNTIDPNSEPEDLANRLDEALASRGNVFPPAESYDPRIDAALRLANATHPEMSPEMMARVRSKVTAAHRQKMRHQRVWRPTYAMAARLAAILVIAIICFNATVLPSLANSVPGEFWYPFKRSLENVELSIAPSLSAKADVYLDHAQRRIQEAQTLLQRKLFDTSLMLDVNENLTSFEQIAPQLSTDTIDSLESKAASVSESVAILLQDAEQLQVLSGNQVMALLPTIMPPSESAPVSSATPTPQPSFTLTPSAQPSATWTSTAQPTVSATVAASASPTLESSLTPEATTIATEEASPAVENTEADTPAPSLTPVPTQTETAQPATTMYASAKANVRSKPGTDQTIITALEPGTAVEVIGEDDAGKWWHVQLQDGRLGWVAKFLLTVDRPTASNSDSNGTGGDFGCDHPGNYCNAPGQTRVPPGTSGTPGNPGNGNPPSNPGNPGGGNSNPGNPPPNPGNGHKP